MVNVKYPHKITSAKHSVISEVLGAHKPSSTEIIELVTLVEETGSSDRILSIYDNASSRQHHSSTVEDLALATVISSYVNYYASGDNHTARAKRYDLNYFLDFLVERVSPVDEVRVRDWTLQATKDYIAHRLSMGESGATVSRRLATLKHLGRTLAERVPGFINPAREARGPVLQQTKPQSLTSQEIALLREAATPPTDEGLSFATYRNYALLEFLLSTGLRADEARKLKMKQVSADLKWLKDVQTKGKKFRNVYLEEQLRPIFSDYLKRREEMINEMVLAKRLLQLEDLPLAPVFISFRGLKFRNPQSLSLAPKTLWRIIADIGSKAQALSPTPLNSLHPHLLRHTFALGLLEVSHDVRLVAQALGHSDVRTTMRYTERQDEEVAKAIEKKREK